MAAEHPLVGIVADDLTGALDGAGSFAAHGFSCFVAVDGDAEAANAGAEVVAVNSGTRDLAWAEAGPRAIRAEDWMRDLEPRHRVRKIDSALRGHVGNEADLALASAPPGSVLLLTPAYPRHGRTVVDGRLRVASSDARLRRHGGEIRAQLAPGAAVFDLGLDRLRAGEGALVAAEVEHRGGGVLLCDAETDDDLALVVRAGLGLETPVWAGSSALTAQLARLIAPPRSSPSPAARDARRVLVVVGSGSSVAAGQVDRARRAGCPVLGPDDGRAIAAALDDAGVATIWAGSPDSTEASLDDAVALRLAAAVDGVIDRVDALVLVGGETAHHVLRRLGVTGIRLDGELDDGVPYGRTAGALLLPIITKAGSFGSPDALLEAIAHLSGRDQHA